MEMYDFRIERSHCDNSNIEAPDDCDKEYIVEVRDGIKVCEATPEQCRHKIVETIFSKDIISMEEAIMISHNTLGITDEEVKNG